LDGHRGNQFVARFTSEVRGEVSCGEGFNSAPALPNKTRCVGAFPMFFA